MYSKPSWIEAHGQPQDEVAPDTYFQRVSLGPMKTCVVVAVHKQQQQQPAAGSKSPAAVIITTKETCYKTFLENDESSTTVQDFRTGKSVELPGICSTDRARAAELLGIPARLDILSLWENQCGGVRAAALSCQFVAVFPLFFLFYQLFAISARDATSVGISCRAPIQSLLIPPCAIVLNGAANCVWFFVIKTPGYHVGSALLVSTAVTALYTMAFVMEIVVIAMRRHADAQIEKAYDLETSESPMAAGYVAPRIS
ncbi:hypothetical protein PINS_up019210 [Pythium insidiosum]|nr:hypothetical protein PINS_up019210 [Pythium insidiosum]